MQTIEELKHQSEIPVIVANCDGIVIYVSDRFEAVFGWRREEIVGKLLTAIMPAYFRDAHHLGLSRFSAVENSQILNHPLRLKAVTKDGREIESEHFIIAEKQDGKWIFGATLSPLDSES